MRNRYPIHDSYTTRCPGCGGSARREFGGYCGSGCVETAVDENIARRHEQEDRDEDRREREDYF